jgi:hypothetical protein
VSASPRRIDRYEIVREIGQGGMARVYLAHQVDLGREVALKQLAGVHASDPSAVARFLHESRLTGRLAHPNIVTVFEYFEDGGIPYIAMEYLPRGSLRTAGPLSLAQVGLVLECVLAALAYAGARGIVHRDLKPENLLITEAGGIKVADFGIAKALGEVSPGFATGTGTTIGTPAYMAPEQATSAAVSPATDLYATGIIAYELLVGRVPFTSRDTPLAVLLQQVNAPPPPPRSIRPELDPELEEWVQWMLEKRPEDRPPDARAAWERLEEILLRVLGPRWRRDVEISGGTGDVAPPPAAATPAPAVPVREAPAETPATPDTPAPTITPAPAAPPPPPLEGYQTFRPGEEPQEAAPGPAPAPGSSEPAPATGFATYDPQGRRTPSGGPPAVPPPPPEPQSPTGFATYEPPARPAAETPPPPTPPPPPPVPPPEVTVGPGDGDDAAAGPPGEPTEGTRAPVRATVEPEAPPAGGGAPGRGRRRAALVAGAAALVVGIVAAVMLMSGGDDDDVASAGSTTSAPTTTIAPTSSRLTVGEYRAAANAICGGYPNFNDVVGTADTREQLVSVLKLYLDSSLRPAIARFGALEPPLAREQAHREILAVSNEKLNLIQQLLDTLPTVSDPEPPAHAAGAAIKKLDARQDRVFREIGATDCVEEAARAGAQPAGGSAPS